MIKQDLTNLPRKKMCNAHKGHYMSVCSFPLCTDQRLCCLRCMVSKHTDHVNYLILLDELNDSNIQELSVPMNWTNLLGSIKDDLGQVIRVCKKNTSQISEISNFYEQDESKIDQLIEALKGEVFEYLDKVKSNLKRLCKERNSASAVKLNQLMELLKQVLSPYDLLNMINDYIFGLNLNSSSSTSNVSNQENQVPKNQPLIRSNSKDKNGMAFMNTTNSNSNMNKQQQEKQLLQINSAVNDNQFEEKLKTFFTKPRITEIEHEEIYQKFNFLTKNRTTEDILLRNPINLTVVNQIRQSLLNVLDQKTKFSEIFFTENQLYDYQNLEQIQVYTSVFDQLTVNSTIATVINAIHPLDSKSFILVRDVENYEIWNTNSQSMQYSFQIPGPLQMHLTPIKTQSSNLLLFVNANNTLNLFNIFEKTTLKAIPLTSQSPVQCVRLVSDLDHDTQIVNGAINIAVLHENGELKIYDIYQGTSIDMRNKASSIMDVLPENRYYMSHEKGVIVSSQLLITASMDMLSVWYPLSGQCVRTFKTGAKSSEQLKQVGAFEITASEQVVTFFADNVVNCPSRFAVAVLTNKSLRIFNWFKAQCLREIAIEDYDKFEILPVFVKNELQNMFLLFIINENKPAQYVTCDWSQNNVQYWNSGSLSNYFHVKALNQYKVLEIGRYVQNGDQTTNSSDTQTKALGTIELRARLKTFS